MNRDGLPGAIQGLAGALNQPKPMNLPPMQSEDSDRDILRGVEKNLATLTERVANVQAGVNHLSNKLEKIDDELITKEEYTFMKRWLTGTTVGLVITFALACIALAGVIAIVIYLGGLG